jgi:hypothetical protein
MNELSKMNELEIEDHWTHEASDLLLGKKITRVRYVNQREADDMGWTSRPVAFMLETGIWLFASMDDEGNDGGALFTSHPEKSVLPVLR